MSFTSKNIQEARQQLLWVCLAWDIESEIWIRVIGWSRVVPQTQGLKFVQRGFMLVCCRLN